MYRCNDCGGFFEEPIITYDDPSPRDIALPMGLYADTHCPMCGSEDIDEAGACVSCGEPVAKDQTLCDDCKEELREYIKDVATNMHIPLDDMEEAVEETWR